ncbi:general stress protein [Atopococcus tabaci]|uniref:general stress protein n=1 Tax=Atopococcus tabaci TaxID=269774 RepID=UPI000422C933|nr:general stress protein [Atopococcus tabaci]
MEEALERRVEGTYQTVDEAKEAVQRLLNEGYQTDEILLIVEDDSGFEEELRKAAQVPVDAVDVDEEDSFWDRIVEAFTFNDDDEDSLEKYGVREENAERFNSALEANEIVLLVDSAAPRHNGSLSEVNEQVLASEPEDTVTHSDSSLQAEATPNEKTIYQGGSNDMTDKEKKQNINEVGSDEEKEVTPSDVDTSETNTDAMESTHDASQAQNTREEEDAASGEATSQSEKTSAESTPDKGDSLETTPELTGDEDTVVKDPSGDHRYPDNIAKGTVDGKDNK